MAGRILIRRLGLSLPALMLMLLCCSCAGKPRTQMLVNLEGGKVKRVAVLPFLDDSGFKQGGTIVQRVFTSELGKMDGIIVCMEGDLRDIYRQERIFSYQLPDIEQRRIIGSRLEADLLIVGKVRELTEKDENPVLDLELQVYDGGSGRTMWTTYHKKEGEDYRRIMHFGIIKTVTGLSREMSREVLKEWFPESARQ